MAPYATISVTRFAPLSYFAAAQTAPPSMPNRHAAAKQIEFDADAVIGDYFRSSAGSRTTPKGIQTAFQMKLQNFDRASVSRRKIHPLPYRMRESVKDGVTFA